MKGPTILFLIVLAGVLGYLAALWNQMGGWR